MGSVYFNILFIIEDFLVLFLCSVMPYVRKTGTLKHNLQVFCLYITFILWKFSYVILNTVFRMNLYAPVPRYQYTRRALEYVTAIEVTYSELTLSLKYLTSETLKFFLFIKLMLQRALSESSVKMTFLLLLFTKILPLSWDSFHHRSQPTGPCDKQMALVVHCPKPELCFHHARNHRPTTEYCGVYSHCWAKTSKQITTAIAMQ
jgi:hypothetical protein